MALFLWGNTREKIISLITGGLKVGEPSMELLENNVKNNVEDIRELKKRAGYVERDVHDLKTNQQVASQTMQHVMDTLNNLKGDFKALDEEIKNSNKRIYEDNIEQLKQYKTTVWGVGGSIIGTLIIAMIVFALNI